MPEKTLRIRKKTYKNSREFYHRLYTQKTLDDDRWLEKTAKEFGLKVGFVELKK